MPFPVVVRLVTIVCLAALCAVVAAGGLSAARAATSAPSRAAGPLSMPETLPEGWKTYILQKGISVSLPGDWKTQRVPAQKKPADEPNGAGQNKKAAEAKPQANELLFQAYLQQDGTSLAGIQILRQPLPRNLLGIDHNAALERTSPPARMIPHDQIVRSLAGGGFENVTVHEARYLKLNGHAARYFRFSYERKGAPLTASRVLMPGRDHMLVVVLFYRESLGERGGRDMELITSSFHGGEL